MDCVKYFEPYFIGFNDDIKNDTIQKLIESFPLTPTLDSQQSLIHQLDTIMPNFSKN